MLQDIVLFFPHKIILKLMFPVLGTSLLPSACCAEQVHLEIPFALGLKPGVWKHRTFVETLPQAPWERWSGRWTGT